MHVHFHSRMITIQTTHGLRDIKADVLWPFAVHLVPKPDGEGDITQGYNLTHIPTGYLIGNVHDHLGAGALIAALLEMPLDWSTSSANDITQWNKDHHRCIRRLVAAFEWDGSYGNEVAYWPGEVQP